MHNTAAVPAAAVEGIVLPSFLGLIVIYPSLEHMLSSGLGTHQLHEHVAGTKTKAIEGIQQVLSWGAVIYGLRVADHSSFKARRIGGGGSWGSAMQDLHIT